MAYVPRYTPATRKLRSNGVATAEAILTPAIVQLAKCWSTYTQSPYGTPGTSPAFANTLVAPGSGDLHGNVSLRAVPAIWGRKRYGITYALSTFPSGTTFSINFQPTPNAITSGYLPTIYMSSTDDHGLYTSGTKTAYDWEDNLDTFIGTVAANDGALNTFSIPFATLSPFFGANASFIFGFNKEMDGTATGLAANSFNSYPVTIDAVLP